MTQTDLAAAQVGLRLSDFLSVTEIEYVIFDDLIKKLEREGQNEVSGTK